MAERIITPAEAAALRQAATPGPWRVQVRRDPNGLVEAGDGLVEHPEGERVGDAVLIAAAPDLARSVEHHAARADRAEAQVVALAEQRDRMQRQIDESQAGADLLRIAEALGSPGAHPDAMIAAIAALRTERDRLARLWDRQADRWCVHVPDGNTEWFDARARAEAFAVEWMTEDLGNHGEARDKQCVILAVVATTEEIVGATSDDAEWLRESGFDYEVTGYRVTPRQESYHRGDLIHPAAEQAIAERDRLARALAVERGDQTQAAPGWEPRGADMWVRGTSPSRPVIQRWHRDGQPTAWHRRGEIGDHRWPTALDAMEAIDAGVARG